MKNKQYQIIYADPPWKQTKGGLRKSRPNQTRSLDYKTLPLMDIRRVIDRTPKKETHTIFLWTIDKYLHKAEELFSDYKLHARIIWDKENGVAPAFTIRYAHEYLLWLYKPKMLTINKECRGKFTTVMRERSTKHSKKPVVARNMINSLYPNHDKIELFAREKTEGWDVWGNEVECDIDLIKENCMKLKDIQEHKRTKQWIGSEIKLEEHKGAHTYHKCKCGRGRCRSDMCAYCWRDCLAELGH